MNDLQALYSVIAGGIAAVAWFIRLESSVKVNEQNIRNLKEDLGTARKDFLTAIDELKKNLEKMTTNQDSINKEHFNKLSAIEITLARVDGKLDLAMSMQNESNKNSRS